MKTTLLKLMLGTAVLTSCGGSHVLENISGNDARASVVLLSENDQVNYFTDFFPAIEKFDSVTVGEGLTLGAVDAETFVVNTDGKTQLSTLNLWANGRPLTLVVEDGRNFKTGYARLYTSNYDANRNMVTVKFTAKPTKVVALWMNTQLPSECVKVSDNDIQITVPTLPQGIDHRSYLRVYAATASSPMSDILLPLEGGKVVTSTDQLDRHDPETQILYSLMIDRFQNGNPDNDWSYNKMINEPGYTGPKETVLPQADYQGGDIAGVTQKIEDGFFESLGINTIWISPITQNPYDVWGEYPKPYTKFTGYHGYWPIYVTSVEKRFATDEELHHMLQVAHEHGLNVILDYVANHLHINSPLFQQHQDWATPSVTPDGRPNMELWDEFRLTTWFDKHIPSLDLERQDIADQMTDSALFWVKNFEFDGFRHDACKHIPLNYWRTFTKKLRTDPQLKDKNYWMIGETYGDPALIGSYVKTGMLNAQFDFNIYHTAIDVFSNHNNRPMQDLMNNVEESCAAYGAHHTMGNISGNHDKNRFVSLAGGDLSWDEDGKAAGWNRHVGVGDSVRGFAKSLLLNKLNLTLPGVPCIYQGDEYGQEGANDPDNRRFMRFDGYNRFEQHNLDETRALAMERRNNIELQFGDMLPLYCDDATTVFLRVYLGKGYLVAINNADKAVDITVTIPEGLVVDAGSRTIHIEASDAVIERL